MESAKLPFDSFQGEFSSVSELSAGIIAKIKGDPEGALDASETLKNRVQALQAAVEKASL